jgi:hypothetical protein
MWPLLPAALASKDLAPFKPLNYSTPHRAFELGLIDLPVLNTMLGEPGIAVASPSEMLKIFLNTASYIDRTRDIEGRTQTPLALR